MKLVKDDMAESFALAKRSDTMDLLERGLAEDWTLDTLRKAILNRRASPPIPGIDGSPADESRYCDGRMQYRSGGGGSIGQRFVSSEMYRSACKQKGGRPRFEVEIPDACQFRSNPFSATDEALTSITKLPAVVPLAQQSLTVATLFGQAVTDAMTVRYIQQDTFTSDAGAVAEGATKPSTSLDVSEVDATVRKIAVTTKTTMEMVEDFPMMQNFVNTQLALQVGLREDIELLQGTGAANRIKGLLNFSGLQTLDATSYTWTGDALEAAVAYVRGANGSGFVEPDAVIMHPLDYLTLKMTKDGNNQAYGGTPFAGPYGSPMPRRGYVCDLPCAITTSVPRGTAIVGAFRIGGTIFRRMGLTISSTDSNEDDFLKNLICVRAEERLTLAVFTPASFCTVTNIPA